MGTVFGFIAALTPITNMHKATIPVTTKAAMNAYSLFKLPS